MTYAHCWRKLMADLPKKGGMLMVIPSANAINVPPEIEEECLKIMSRAKLVLLRHRFFGSLSLTMPYKAIPGLGTYATDGKFIYYDPFTVVKEGTVKECVSSIVHEVLHKIFRHFMRKEFMKVDKKLLKKFNHAADLAINPILKEEGFYCPPEHFVYERKYDGWSMERIFKDLKDSDIPEDTQIHIYFPSSGEDDEQPASEEELENMATMIEAQVLNAAMAAEEYGLKSGKLKSMIEGLKKNQVDWKAKLQLKVMGTNPEDYSWKRPNRRYLHQNLYLPSTEKKGVGRIYIWPDSSGSISAKDAEAIASEMKYILEHIKPEKTIIVQCDSKVHGTVEFHSGEFPKTFDFVGRGGTDPTPFFEYVEDQQDAHCAICLTDMYFNHNSYPVIWVSVSSCTNHPFGDLVQITV